jgi:hypothetical protein
MANSRRPNGNRPLLPRPRLLLPNLGAQHTAAASTHDTRAEPGQVDGRLSFLGLLTENCERIYTFLLHAYPQYGDSNQISYVRNGHFNRYRCRTRPEVYHH